MNSKQIPLFALALVAALVIGLAACGDGDDDTEADTDEATEEAEETAEPAADELGEEASSGAEVAIEGFAFNPADLQVNVGDTVTWTNLDPTGHTVTENSGAFDSGSVSGAQTFEFTFATAGEFAYHCEFHPGMTGTISVGEGSQSPAQDGAEPASDVDFGY